ncbi:glycoside hydrolase family 3 C-terminal domain-containing protein [Cohnella lubricantis]|uniref:Glycoside hydrolase family 3 C-terminal domain-containing protein n=2 Tax=Cohnella lubricantis TaxID=2163172 RepID=A0A841TAM4_9BACL|nr:glycoside hydrolase family 3 C-terminal domain-containing protein [Cohnella lubricantis]
MTLEEKAGLCSGADWWTTKGIERLGLAPIRVADGPHGLRKQKPGAAMAGSEPATCFPTAAGLAASWSRQLAREVGAALGVESRAQGVAVLLGPGINLKRSPLCGRNFEYYAEDPYLSGMLAAAFIEGVQSQGVGTSLKHFAVNNQEHLRMTIDAEVDERALRELYLTGFELAVKHGRPWTVMGAYNRVNGSYACENDYLLRDILRGEWGFEGAVMSDWGGTNDRVAGLRAGLDLQMPTGYGYTDREIVDAVKEGRLAESVLDESAARIVRLLQMGAASAVFDKDAHHRLARKAAARSMVLLKNEGDLLPLRKTGTVALIGEFAEKPRCQGAGSSLVNPTRLDTARAASASDAVSGLTVRYAKGYDSRSAEPDPKLIAEACELARGADAVVILAGLLETDEMEGADRTHLELPAAHNELIRQVAKANPRVVVALSNGAPVTMPWADAVPAILETYLGGQAAGSALWDVLLGEENPSGKLAETFPLTLEDCAATPFFPMGPDLVEYRESIYVGYRYYDKARRDVLYPFGHGLSYTKFEYAELRLSRRRMTDTEELTVSCKVKNAGSRAGRETVQLYVKDVQSTIFRPERELKGFEQLELAPGEEKSVTLMLDRRAFAYYNVELRDWQVESGEFEIQLGASSRDIRLSERVHVEAAQTYDERRNDRRDELAAYYDLSRLPSVDTKTFAALCGRPIEADFPPSKRRYHRNSTMIDIRRHWIGRILMNRMMKEVEKGMAGQEEKTVAMTKAFIRELPLRNLPMISNGMFTPRLVSGLIDLLNGRIVRSIGQFIKRT